ncbi:MAG TPA: MBL fold metallo-hydrolase [Methylomirabilota bacterium]|jgi:glyoxylase-like metal-dependent hydrolase (beta-lactamase superfamily II)
MTTLTLGDVTVTRVVEIGRSTYPTASMLPTSTPDAIARHRGWLEPFWDASTDDLGSRIGTWVVRTPEHLVLIDTGVGNDKKRENALWNLRRGTFLDDLGAAGVMPEQVDLVVITHMHVDHVGWNTRLVNGRWVPTFPRARYVFAGEEWSFWKHESARGGDESGCIDDSVLPIVAAGQADLVDIAHRIDPWLRFEPSVGHTPGHVSVRLSTSAGEAVFSGDLMHRVVQVAEPEWSSRFCYDATRAAQTRREFVERHADSGTLILPAHFPRPGYIVRAGEDFRFEGRN